MKSQRTKNQHYVPQLLLRRFCGTDGRVFVFDKVKRAVFQSSPEAIASEQRFFDDPSVETIFTNLETETAPHIAELLREVEINRRFDAWHHERRATIGLFLAAQATRTRLFRANTTQLMGLVKGRVEKMRERMQPKPDDPLADLPSEMTSARHADFLFGTAFLEQAARVLCDHIWYVAENDTDQPFFISDAPLVRHAHVPQGGLGLASRGIEVALPLSPKHILVLLERSHFERQQDKEGRVQRLLPGNVAWYNSHQIINSYRQIYCAKDKFDQVRKYEKEHPDVFALNRPRIDVRGGGVD